MSPSSPIISAIISSQAIETYGVDRSFRILRDAERLPQTESTIDWLIGQLHRSDLDLASIDNDSATTCLELLCDEQDGDVQLELGHALLAHFEFEGVELVQQLVEGNEEDLHPDERSLRSRLVAAATIMGETFPEYEEWHDDAVRTNYGWFEYERKRIAGNFGA
ncbi:MAG TPA: hypothetical protein VMM76_19460 [Pirellulaceae bacterium]|nr:hypothetical protein [Pirellulaceae bacterium]